MAQFRSKAGVSKIPIFTKIRQEIKIIKPSANFGCLGVQIPKTLADKAGVPKGQKTCRVKHYRKARDIGRQHAAGNS